MDMGKSSGLKFMVSAISIICLLSGCGSKTQLPAEPIIYEQGENTEDGYSYLAYEDKMFIPYCAYKAKYLGDCIGYCDIPADEYTDASRVYIFEFKGYSSDEWIIETPALSNCNEGMVLREVNASNIPEGLESEYEWNDLHVSHKSDSHRRHFFISYSKAELNSMLDISSVSLYSK